MDWSLNQSRHPKMRAMVALALRAAKTQAPILIQGETGTGKEVLARYIHQMSERADKPWVAINCAALPESMIEAILFGYEKGSFTSAIQSYAGKFEQAHQGTLLLDEIGELPLAQQAKLLRVLQTHEVERLGAKQSTSVNIRVIAATNQDLRTRVEQGLFRMDLYYRLSVINLTCLPLRERDDDMMDLANIFLQEQQKQVNKSGLIFTDAAEKKMKIHNWPGNIRELENTIQRATIMDTDHQIDEDDILFQEAFDLSTEDQAFNLNSLKDHESSLILKVLRESNGMRSVAAKKLQISPRTLRHKIMKLKAIGCDVP